MQVSKRAVAKVVQVIDRLMQRNEKFTNALRTQQHHDEDGNAIALPQLEDALRQSQIEIMTENRNLQNLNTALHERHHTISLKLKELQDTLTGKETEAAELHNQIDDFQYELGKIRLRNDKLENHLAEAIEKLKTYHQMHGEPATGAKAGGSAGGSSSASDRRAGTTSVATQHLEELQKELEESRELAANRLLDLDKKQRAYCDALKEVEKLKMDVSAFLFERSLHSGPD